MGDHKGGRHDLEAENSLARRFLHILPDQIVIALGPQSLLDLAQHLDHIGAGTAAGIEDIDVLVSQTVGYAHFGAKDGIDPFHHIADDLARGVPDTHLFAQFGIKGFEEGFVEVLHRLTAVKGCEECGAIYPVQRLAGAVEDAHQAKRREAAGFGHLFEKGADHRHSHDVGGRFPVELAGSTTLGPDHPC